MQRRGYALPLRGRFGIGFRPTANKAKYPNQRLFVVRIDDYAWLVPYAENEYELFPKTIIPSRKATKKFLGEAI